MENSTVRYLFVSAASQFPANPSTAAVASISKVINTAARPLDRHRLLVLNITVSSDFANMWSVGSVTLSGQSLKWNATKAVTAAWHLIILQPPDEGRVSPGGLPLFFLDRTLTITCLS